MEYEVTSMVCIVVGNLYSWTGVVSFSSDAYLASAPSHIIDVSISLYAVSAFVFSPAMRR